MPSLISKVFRSYSLPMPNKSGSKCENCYYQYSERSGKNPRLSQASLGTVSVTISVHVLRYIDGKEPFSD